MKRITGLLLLLLSTGLVFGQTKRVLVEEFSTAPCGFCPDGTLILEEMHKKYPNMLTFTHHAGFGTDSMTIPQSVVIAKSHTTFAPGATFDRVSYPIPTYTYPNYIAVSRQKWDSLIGVRLQDEVIADIALNNTYNASTNKLTVDVTTKFYKTPASGDIRINIAIVEDSVTGTGKGYDQKNYFNGDRTRPSLYQKGDEIPGYVHRHVVRAMPTGDWGVSGIVSSNPKEGDVFSYSLKDFSIDPKWKAKHTRVIAWVGYHNTKNTERMIFNSFQKNMTDNTQTYLSIGESIAETIQLSVYPNPSTDLVTLTAYKPITYILNDINGRVLLVGNTKNKTHQIQMSSLPTGTYFIKAQSDKGVTTTKFIKN